MLVSNLWRELNGLAMTKTIPLSVVKASFNMARTAQIIYEHGDDKSKFTVDDYVQTLIFTSLPTSSQYWIEEIPNMWYIYEQSY